MGRFMVCTQKNGKPWDSFESDSQCLIIGATTDWSTVIPVCKTTLTQCSNSLLQLCKSRGFHTRNTTKTGTLWGRI